MDDKFVVAIILSSCFYCLTYGQVLYNPAVIPQIRSSISSEETEIATTTSKRPLPTTTEKKRTPKGTTRAPPGTDKKRIPKGTTHAPLSTEKKRTSKGTTHAPLETGKKRTPKDTTRAPPATAKPDKKEKKQEKNKAEKSTNRRGPTKWILITAIAVVAIVCLAVSVYYYNQYLDAKDEAQQVQQMADRMESNMRTISKYSRSCIYDGKLIIDTTKSKNTLPKDGRYGNMSSVLSDEDTCDT